MTSQKIALDYKSSKWAQVIRDRQSSGMKIKEYCAATGINESAYYYWLRRLRETACFDLTSNLQKSAVPNENTASNGWMLCHPAKPSTSEPALTIEIGNGKINITTEVDPELLTKVCRVLMNLC